MFRIFRYVIIGLLLLSPISYAAVNQVSEEDGTPSMFPWKIKVPNTSLTNNGDGTASLGFTGAFTFSALTSTYLPYVNVSKQLVNSNMTTDGTNFSTTGTLGAGVATLSSVITPTLYGSSASGGNLTLQSTAHATKGKILFGTSVYDEVNNRLGIGTTSPGYSLDVQGSAATSGVSAQAGFNIDVVNAPTAPTGVATAGAGMNTGNHKYFITYVNAIGETGAGTKSADIATASPNLQVTLTIPVSTDTRVTQRKIYRNKATGDASLFYYLATVANNTATTYLDAIPDSTPTGNGRSDYRANTTSKYLMLDGIKGLMIDEQVTSLGLRAGNAVSEAGNSVFVGTDAGYKTSTGSFNTVVGGIAFYNNTTGQSNTVLGRGAMYNSATGDGNVAIGYNAAVNQNGASNNVSLGFNAGRTITTGGTNVFIGYQAGYNGSQKVDAANSIAIGAYAYTTASNQVVIGDTGITQTILRGSVGIGTTSPLRSLDINNVSGNCLRLIYNDSDGSAANYADFLVGSTGDLTITPSGNDLALGTTNVSTSGTIGGGAITGTSLIQSTPAFISGQKFSKSFTITNCTAAGDGSLWRAPVNLTITAVHLLCKGGTVTGHLTEQDANGLNDAGVDGATDITGVTNTNVDDDASLSNPSIDAGDYIGWRTTSITGTNTYTIITFEGYTN